MWHSPRPRFMAVLSSGACTADNGGSRGRLTPRLKIALLGLRAQYAITDPIARADGLWR